MTAWRAPETYFAIAGLCMVQSPAWALVLFADEIPLWASVVVGVATSFATAAIICSYLTARAYCGRKRDPV